MVFLKPVYASCPFCIATFAGGLFIAKKLGIDDLLVSIWISGLNTAIAFFIASKIKEKAVNNPVFWSIIFYILAILYLWHTNQIGHLGNTLWGIDKVLLGMTVGLAISFFSVFIDKTLRLKNSGKVLFYYQKVIIPFILLIFTTFFLKVLLNL